MTPPSDSKGRSEIEKDSRPQKGNNLGSAGRL
jgi:hypothetical protein